MSITFRQGYLSGISVESKDPARLISDDYDLLVLASSWDARCLSITECAELKSMLCLALFFDTRDKKGLRDKHDRQIESFSKRTSREYLPIKGSSTQVGTLWQIIEEHIRRLRRRSKHSLKVLIDLSACPRYYSLGVLSLCLSERLANSITIFYAEGRYKEDREQHEFAFTGGRWKLVPVPYLSGLCDPGKERFYLVSVGFEGIKTLRAVTYADPERVSLLFPSPGFRPEYAKITRRNNADIIKEYRIPEEQIVRSSAGDAIAAWKALDGFSLDRPADENSYYLCCGTKPHSLALALRALALEYPAVLYNIPEEHAVHETEPAGTYWRFDIRDLSALPL